jgi:hypothetical protein
VRRTIWIIILAVSSACSGRRPPIVHPSAPEPAGCFVEVFAQEEFAGARDYINGPATHRRLNRLPFESNWHNRIRSVRVGPTATVLLWAKENFQGNSLKFGPDRNHPRLIPDFRGRVASLAIECTDTSVD